MRHTRHHAAGEGFTLIEALVVIALMVLLIAITLPALSYARRQGRSAACVSNLEQVARATQMHLNTSNGRLWRYYRDEPDGRQWWFGFEEGGPGTGTGRPLDKTRSPLFEHLPGGDERLQCPSFPYDDPAFYPKFVEPAASYGFNLHLGPANVRVRAARIDDLPSPARTFVFADAIHFDHNPGFNEGHYIAYTPNTRFASGYGHFRHNEQANLMYADGHVDSVDPPTDRDIHGLIDDAPATNLATSDEAPTLYGTNRR